MALPATNCRAKDEDAGRHVGEVVLGDAIESLVAVAAQTLEGSYARMCSRAPRILHAR